MAHHTFEFMMFTAAGCILQVTLLVARRVDAHQCVAAVTHPKSRIAVELRTEAIRTHWFIALRMPHTFGVVVCKDQCVYVCGTRAVPRARAQHKMSVAGGTLKLHHGQHYLGGARRMHSTVNRTQPKTPYRCAEHRHSRCFGNATCAQ